MRWNKVDNGYWECVFENVPFIVRVASHSEGVVSRLYLPDVMLPFANKIYPSIDVAQAEVESFVLDHLALYSAQVHRECLEANVMTWRKLKEQLNQIPEDQLDDVINHLDTDGYWVGEPRIELTDCDMYADEEDFKDCTGNTFISDDAELVVEKGKYFLSTCQV